MNSLKFVDSLDKEYFVLKLSGEFGYCAIIPLDSNDISYHFDLGSERLVKFKEGILYNRFEEQKQLCVDFYNFLTNRLHFDFLVGKGAIDFDLENHVRIFEYFKKRAKHLNTIKE